MAKHEAQKAKSERDKLEWKQSKFQSTLKSIKLGTLKCAPHALWNAAVNRSATLFHYYAFMLQKLNRAITRANLLSAC